MNSEQLVAAVDAASVRCLTTLIHFLWQGLAIALAAGWVLWCLRRATASLRYTVAVAALALMALCPVGTYLFLDGTSPERPAPVAAPVPEPRSLAVNDPVAPPGPFADGEPALALPAS